MIEADWKPSPRKLRQFALASLIGLPALAILIQKLALWLADASWARQTSTSEMLLWGAAAGAVVAVAGSLVPRTVWPLYALLLCLALPIGLLLSWILIPAVYYGVFTPMGLALRLLGKDPLDRGFQHRETYWINRPPTPAPAKYYKQY